MRIIKKDIDHRDVGYIRLQAETADDMYHMFNVIMQQDLVEASTVRNVTRESKTGSVEKNRIRIWLKIDVEKVEFDSEQCSLRVAGRNTAENDHVKMGQYHTVTLEIGHQFVVYKDAWDSIYLNRVKDAVDSASKAELAAIVMQEGLAHVCLVTPFMTQTRARIERKMPKKKDGGEKYDKAVKAFFKDVFEAVRKYINFEIVKLVLCGSPGFLKDDFYLFMEETATRQDDTGFLKQKSKFLRAHASSGHKKAIDEMLGNPDIHGQMEDIKAAKEVHALQRFHKMMTEDEDRAVYGFDATLAADEQLAIDELLVTDKLFLGQQNGEGGGQDLLLRKQYVGLTESVKAHGGKVHIFSSMHVSGQQLDNYTGCAAILRFPLPEVLEGGADEDAMSNGTDSDEEDEAYARGRQEDRATWM
jgi:protein pelota